ncbi:MAG: hypothetical protein JWO53_482 [Chlamydiia bacterium]|nr:hypothetical protein [Chlamydiia bacterium]
MNKKLFFENIDFADSVYTSCEMKEKFLIINLTSWDDKIIHLSFSNPIQFSYKMSYGMTGVYEVLEDSAVLEKALSLKYEKIPLNHGFKLYQLIDSDDFIFFEIVAQAATATKID